MLLTRQGALDTTHLQRRYVMPKKKYISPKPSLEYPLKLTYKRCAIRGFAPGWKGAPLYHGKIIMGHGRWARSIYACEFSKTIKDALTVAVELAKEEGYSKRVIVECQRK